MPGPGHSSLHQVPIALKEHSGFTTLLFFILFKIPVHPAWGTPKGRAEASSSVFNMEAIIWLGIQDCLRKDTVSELYPLPLDWGRPTERNPISQTVLEHGLLSLSHATLSPRSEQHSQTPGSPPLFMK